MDEELLASHVDAIHGADLAEFTAERDRRVKQLRGEGHRDEAAALKACRKPTVPAWAVDQLARRAPDEVADLIEAAETLRSAQHRAASGRGADGLREAARQVRDRVGALRERAATLLVDAGTRPDAHLDDVEQTLFAAAVDPDQHATLRRGVFAAVLPGSGFGAFGLMAVPDVAAAPPTSTRDAAAGATVTDDEDTAARAAEEARRAEEERRAEQERLLAARRRELMRRIDALEAARDKRADRVRRAQDKADDLRARFEAAEHDAEAARADLAELTSDLDAARRELDDLAAAPPDPTP